MIRAVNIKTNENIILSDRYELKRFLKFLYGRYPKNINSLINRNKPYKGKWLFKQLIRSE